MNLQTFALGFLAGFMFAAWLAYRRQARERERQASAYQAVRSEVYRLLDSVKDLTQVEITIKDETGELHVESEVPKKDLH